MKHFPNCGLQDHHTQKSQLVRQYILEISGYTRELPPQSPYGPKSKKYAMVALYKLWSAFSKGLRHTANSKHKPILVPQIGVWAEKASEGEEETTMQFHPAVELQNAIGAEFKPELTQAEATK